MSNGDHAPGPKFATAQGPMKPYPPPQLHGYTIRPVSGDLFVALWDELGPDARATWAGATGRQLPSWLEIGPNVAIYPRTDPTPPPPDRRRLAWWLPRLLLGVAGLAVLAPWLIVLAVYVRAFYGLYGQTVVRFFLP